MTLREKLLARINELTARAESPDLSADNLRAILAEIKEKREMVDQLDSEARSAQISDFTEQPPVDAVRHNDQVVASFRSATAEKKEDSVNVLESDEYRQAFKDYVQRGVEIPSELRSKVEAYRASLPVEQRAGVAETTVDTGAAIPFTVMREIINTVRKRYGNLYAKVRKMTIAGGVAFPVGALQATFKWIGESTVSPRQKVGELGKVTFGYHTAELRIAQSFLSQLLTVADFEMKIAEVIAVAYAQMMDGAIVNGTGDGMPLGIVNDTRVTNVYTVTAAKLNNWQEWRKGFFAKLPLGYRGGEFIFPVSTVDAYLSTMADANGRPLYREATGLEINDGDAMYPSGRFFGRDVALVEPDILPDFDAASSGDVIGIFWQPDEYAVNENFGFAMRRYYDEETNEWVDKALVVVDGKVLNPAGFWLIKKA